jgi:hypothetical protein
MIFSDPPGDEMVSEFVGMIKKFRKSDRTELIDNGDVIGPVLCSLG